jgi:hypothetical protein
MKGRKINKTDTYIDSSISFVRPWITINAWEQIKFGDYFLQLRKKPLSTRVPSENLTIKDNTYFSIRSAALWRDAYHSRNITGYVQWGECEIRIL